MKVKKLSLLLALAVLTQLPHVSATEDDDDVNEAAKADEDGDGDTDDDGEEDVTAVKEENGVLILKDLNFDFFVAGKDTVLLEFYAPWCGHCKSFASEYEKIAKALAENDPPVPVAKVDATVAVHLAERFSVSGYPTIKILKKGQAVDYDGDRTQDAIIAKVKEVASPDWKPPPEAVLTLTESNFDEIVNNADIILVEFYAPWCGHCKKLAPEYEKAAQELSKNTPPIPLAKVDATVESELGKRFGVSGYPTLKLFRKGKAYDYNGPREQYGIVSHMIEQAGPASQELKSVKQLNGFVQNGDDLVILGVFKNEQDAALQLFQETGNNVREEFKFYHTFEENIKNHLKAVDGQVVVLHPERFQSKYEPKQYTFDIQADSTDSDLKAFVEKHSVPLVGQRKPSNDAKRYASRRPLVVVFYGVDFSFDYRTATQFWRSKVLEVAKEFPKFTFAIASEEDYSKELSDLGLAESGEEVNAAILDASGKKYAMAPEEFDADVLRDFVISFEKGKLKAVVKSAPLPKSNKGPVKVVVGRTFEQIVLDNSKDVLVEFYAPWCGHCKSLEPIYKDLGKKYKGHKGLVIAKMDATLNDIPHDSYKAEGFPTIYFAPSGAKDRPIKFADGPRDLESLSKFIEKHATKLSMKDEL
ncbi:protein disulfide-isomerase A4 [Lampetra fluviatilis]